MTKLIAKVRQTMATMVNNKYGEESKMAIAFSELCQNTPDSEQKIVAEQYESLMA